MSAHMTPLQQRILAALAGATAEQPVSTNAIAAAIYADDADGGPLSADVCVRSTVYRMRQAVAGMGAVIRSRNGRYGGYWLASPAAPTPHVLPAWWATARKLRADGMTFAAIGARFGVSAVAAYKACEREAPRRPILERMAEALQRAGRRLSAQELVSAVYAGEGAPPCASASLRVVLLKARRRGCPLAARIQSVRGRAGGYHWVAA